MVPAVWRSKLTGLPCSILACACVAHRLCGIRDMQPRHHPAILQKSWSANTAHPACVHSDTLRSWMLCWHQGGSGGGGGVRLGLVSVERGEVVCGAHSVLSYPHHHHLQTTLQTLSACACVCESGSVTSVRTRSWLLWRWRRGRQRRNMTHGKLSRSSESGSRVWPQLWRRARSLRWRLHCISARSFARLAPLCCCSSRAACSPSGFLAEDARLRLLQQCS